MTRPLRPGEITRANGRLHRIADATRMIGADEPMTPPDLHAVRPTRGERVRRSMPSPAEWLFFTFVAIGALAAAVVFSMGGKP